MPATLPPRSTEKIEPGYSPKPAPRFKQTFIAEDPTGSPGPSPSPGASPVPDPETDTESPDARAERRRRR